MNLGAIDMQKKQCLGPDDHVFNDDVKRLNQSTIRKNWDGKWLNPPHSKNWEEIVRVLAVYIPQCIGSAVRENIKQDIREARYSGSFVVLKVRALRTRDEHCEDMLSSSDRYAISFDLVDHISYVFAQLKRKTLFEGKFMTVTVRIVRWRGCAIGRASDLRSRGHGFDSRPGIAAQ